MNGLERRYSERLDVLVFNRAIRSYRYESVKLRLADRTWYTPDFEVVRSDGCVEYHEVKGFMRDDAAVKIKVAAEQYPERAFVLVQRKKSEWIITTIGR